MPNAGARVETRDAGAAGAQLFRQRALRGEVQLQLAGQHLALELLVLAHVGGIHPLDLVRLEQRAHAEIVHAGVVADDGQALGARVEQRADQVFRDAAQAEAAGGDRHVVVQQAVERGLGVRINFAAHVERNLTTDYTDGHG